jgi:mycothiol system anti-sigma-R factor
LTGCKKLLSELSNYLEGELDAANRAELEQHIKKCPNCWVIIDTTRKTIQIYQGCCEPYPLPESLQDRLQQALRKRYEESSEKQG